MPRRSRVPLISRMQRDLREHGRIRPGTATAMWVAYGAHAAITAALLRTPRARITVPPRTSTAIGAAATAAGTGLCLAGMGAFSGLGQLSGTQPQQLVTTGVYRHGRNPQYLGYVVTLAGLAVARRSGAALAATGLIGALYARWVPIEEEHLEATLGEPYRDYLARTHRWWGRAVGGAAPAAAPAGAQP